MPSKNGSKSGWLAPTLAVIANSSWCISTFASRSISNVPSAQVERMTSLVENSDSDEEVEVHRLGRRLFFDAANSIAFHGIDPFYHAKNQTSAKQVALDPNDPAELVNEILEMHVQNADVTAEKTVHRLCQDETTEGKSIRGYKLKCGNAFLRTLDACKKQERERKGEGGPRSQRAEKWSDENGHLLKDSPPGPRKRRQEVVDLSWTYEIGAKMDREAQAGCGTGTSSGGAGGVGLKAEGLAPSGSPSSELDSAGALGVTERSVDARDACRGDADPSGERGENGENDGNKANFDENVAIAKHVNSVEGVANSGAKPGLDKGGLEGAPHADHLAASGVTEQSDDRNSDIVRGRAGRPLPWRDEGLESSRPTAPSSLVSCQSASAGPPPQPSPTRGEGFLGSSPLSECHRHGKQKRATTRGPNRPSTPSGLDSWQSASAGPPPQPSPTRGEGFLGSSPLGELKRPLRVNSREPGGESGLRNRRERSRGESGSSAGRSRESSSEGVRRSRS